MLNRVAGLGLDDFLHEPKKGGGGWWSDIVSFGKGKKQKKKNSNIEKDQPENKLCSPN